jgi:hypothetical protein
MAVIAFTNNPGNLRTAFLNALRDGELETWALKPQSTDQITHTTGQWDNLAWFVPVPSTQNNAVIFKIYFPTNVDLEQVRNIYGMYHGRLTEILIRRFHTYFTDITATGKPKDYETLANAVRERLNA